MEPRSNQESPGEYPLDNGIPPKPNSPGRPSEAIAEIDLRKAPAFSVSQPEFGPIPDVAARKTGEPVPLWSNDEMVSDAEAAQATLKTGPARRVLRVSYPRLALVLIVTGIVGFGIHRLRDHQLGTVAASLRQQADRARQQGRQDLYLQYLKQYIGHNDQDVDALTELATVMSGQTRTTAESESLLALLRRICELAPDRHDARRQLVAIAMGSGRYEEALSNLELLEKVTPDDGELKLLIGRCYEQENALSAAIAAYQASIKCLPEQLDAYESLAGLLRNESQGDEQVFYILDQMVIANRQSPDALILRSRFRLSAGDLSGSSADVRSARAVAPDLPSAHLMVARLATVGSVTDSEELQTAYDHLTRTLDANPEDIGLYQSLALLDMKLGRIPLAEAWLRRGLEFQPGSYRARLQLIVLLVSSGSLDEAAVQFDLLDSANEPLESAIHAGMCLNGFVQMQIQNWRQAVRTLEEVLPQLSNEPALQTWTDSWLAQCFHETQDSDSEIEVLRRILDHDPSALPPRRALALALAEKGNLDDAIAHLSMHREDAEVAVELLRLTFKRALRVSAASRSWVEVDEALQLAENSARSSWEIILVKARIDEARSGAESAIQHLTETVARVPDELDAQLVLVLTALRNGDNVLARETLEKAEQRFGDDVRLDSAWIHFWSWQAADGALPPLTAIEDSLKERPEAERLRLAVQLAKAWVLRGVHEKAEHLWHQLAVQQPENMQVQLLALESSLNSGHWAASAEALSKIEAIEGTGGSFAAACRVAELLARNESGDMRDAEQVRVEFRKLQQLRPNWHVVSALEGRVFQLEGQNRSAEECYRLALENGSRDADVVSRLLTLLCRTNRYKEADLVLQQYEPYWDRRCSQLAASRVSEIAERAGDSDRALDLARRSISTDRATWDSGRVPLFSDPDTSSSGMSIRTTEVDGTGSDLRGADMISGGKVNMFAAEILFSDPELEYRLIFEETGLPDGKPSRIFGSAASLFETLHLTEEQTTFFNAIALNVGGIDN